MSMKSIDRVRRELTMVIHRMETLQRNIDAPHQCCRDAARALGELANDLRAAIVVIENAEH
ncbi:MAG TPA: hypothetical protein VM822_20190 [Pseudolabrys sp.]|nr:hypothetical protein [Pseudolabrys sp.]